MKTHTFRLNLKSDPTKFYEFLAECELELDSLMIYPERLYAVVIGTPANIMSFMSKHNDYIYDGRDEVQDSDEDSVSAV